MDKNALWKYLAKYALTDQGKWLNGFAFRGVKLVELPFQKEGLVTAFYSAAGNTIYLADDREFAVLFAILVHEMRHAWQRHTMGCVKYLLKKAFARKSIEADAETQELLAVDWAATARE